MGGFKENKRNVIEKGKEKGDAALAKGEQRVQELQYVKSLIDSINLEDDEDVEMAESLNESYLEAGKAAHQEEVQEVVDSANQDLEGNKSEVSAERSNVESAAEKICEMQSTTDLARGSASSVESSLRKSVSEYSDMEQQTEQIEAELETNSQNILSRIKSLFN
ncbi:hypothetical protein IMSAGC005_03029 [Lachnospiraceae bacterium]|nr:hypothetical protein IMSAGC005_03029 [Lachnospiraceae bacterium]